MGVFLAMSEAKMTSALASMVPAIPSQHPPAQYVTKEFVHIFLSLSPERKSFLYVDLILFCHRHRESPSVTFSNSTHLDPKMTNNNNMML